MPVERCSSGGKPGWRYGPSGHCYTYRKGSQQSSNNAKRRAYIQGAAITANGGKALDASWIDDPAMWEDLRAAIVPVVEPLFHEAFILGSEMGAMQKPASERGQRALYDVIVDRLESGLRQLDPDTQTVLPYDFDAMLVAAQEVIADYTNEWWNQFSASTQRMLRNVIARAEASGLTTAQVAAELAPLFGEQRALTVAVSELTDLLGMGAQETYRRAGYSYWEWRTVRDSRVDPICERRDRERYPMSVRFRRAHVRCRCWPVPAGRVSVQGSLLGLVG